MHLLKRLLPKSETLLLAIESVFYLAILCFFASPWPMHLNTHVLGGGDAYTFIYKLSWWGDSIKSFSSPYRPLPLVGIFEPTLPAYHDQTPFASFIGGLLTIFISPILAYNFLVIAFYLANALSMSALARYLTKSNAAAWFAGTAFAWSPYIVFRYSGHFNLIQIFGLPLAVLFFEKYIESRLQKYLVFSGLSMALLSLASPYYLFLLAPPFFLYIFLRKISAATPLKDLLILLSVWIIIVIPLLVIPYQSLNRQPWPAKDIFDGSASIWSYLLPFAKIPSHKGLPEADALYISFILPLLAMCGFLQAHRFLRVPLLSIAALSFFISFGPAFIFYRPPFNSMRCPCRAGLVVFFVFIIFAAFAVAKFFQKRRAVLVIPLIVALLYFWGTMHFVSSDARANATELYLASGAGSIGVLPFDGLYQERVVWGTYFHKRRVLTLLGGSQQSFEVNLYRDALAKVYPSETAADITQELGATNILLYLTSNPLIRTERLKNITAWKKWEIKVVADDWAVLAKTKSPD